jgi:hypothetical protein
MKQGYRSIAPAWIVDYSVARERAIKWLGDRYLLAKPINATDNARRGVVTSDTHRQAAG